MKNFDLGVHWKIQLLCGEFKKSQFNIEGDFLKQGGGLGQFADLRGGACWWERGGCFWVGGYTAVSTGNDPLWQQNITQDRKLFVT